MTTKPAQGVVDRVPRQWIGGRRRRAIAVTPGRIDEIGPMDGRRRRRRGGPEPTAGP